MNRPILLKNNTNCTVIFRLIRKSIVVSFTVAPHKSFTPNVSFTVDQVRVQNSCSGCSTTQIILPVTLPLAGVITGNPDQMDDCATTNNTNLLFANAFAFGSINAGGINLLGPALKINGGRC